MTDQQPSAKRKRDIDSSDEDSLNQSTYEIQLSPVPSLLSLEGEAPSAQ